MKEKKLIQHHIKYKEIDGVDEIIWMTQNEHVKLHRKLRKENKCNISVEKLAKISRIAHKRTKKCKYRLRKYYYINKEKYKKKALEWQKKNPDKVIERKKRWRDKNPNYDKEWRDKNPDHMKKYYQKNKESLKIQKKEYYQENKERIKIQKANYRDRKKAQKERESSQ